MSSPIEKDKNSRDNHVKEVNQFNYAPTPEKRGCNGRSAAEIIDIVHRSIRMSNQISAAACTRGSDASKTSISTTAWSAKVIPSSNWNIPP